MPPINFRPAAMDRTYERFVNSYANKSDADQSDTKAAQKVHQAANNATTASSVTEDKVAEIRVPQLFSFSQDEEDFVDDKGRFDADPFESARWGKLKPKSCEDFGRIVRRFRVASTSDSDTSDTSTTSTTTTDKTLSANDIKALACDFLALHQDRGGRDGIPDNFEGRRAELRDDWTILATYILGKFAEDDPSFSSAGPGQALFLAFGHALAQMVVKDPEVDLTRPHFSKPLQHMLFHYLRVVRSQDDDSGNLLRNERLRDFYFNHLVNNFVESGYRSDHLTEFEKRDLVEMDYRVMESHFIPVSGETDTEARERVLRGQFLHEWLFAGSGQKTAMEPSVGNMAAITFMAGPQSSRHLAREFTGSVDLLWKRAHLGARVPDAVPPRLAYQFQKGADTLAAKRSEAPSENKKSKARHFYDAAKRKVLPGGQRTAPAIREIDGKLSPHAKKVFRISRDEKGIYDIQLEDLTESKHRGFMSPSIYHEVRQAAHRTMDILAARGKTKHLSFGGAKGSEAAKQITERLLRYGMRLDETATESFMPGFHMHPKEADAQVSELATQLRVFVMRSRKGGEEWHAQMRAKLDQKQLSRQELRDIIDQYSTFVNLGSKGSYSFVGKLKSAGILKKHSASASYNVINMRKVRAFVAVLLGMPAYRDIHAFTERERAYMSTIPVKKDVNSGVETIDPLTLALRDEEYYWEESTDMARLSKLWNIPGEDLRPEAGRGKKAVEASLRAQEEASTMVRLQEIQAAAKGDGKSSSSGDVPELEVAHRRVIARWAKAISEPGSTEVDDAAKARHLAFSDVMDQLEEPLAQTLRKHGVSLSKLAAGLREQKMEAEMSKSLRDAAKAAAPAAPPALVAVEETMSAVSSDGSDDESGDSTSATSSSGGSSSTKPAKKSSQRPTDWRSVHVDDVTTESAASDVPSSTSAASDADSSGGASSDNDDSVSFRRRRRTYGSRGGDASSRRGRDRDGRGESRGRDHRHYDRGGRGRASSSRHGRR